MHLNEGRMSRQLEMKFNVLENAVNQLINITSALAIENQKIKRHLDMIARGQVSHAEQSKTESHDENFELDISQVQKILKQQQAPNTIGKRVINN